MDLARKGNVPSDRPRVRREVAAIYSQRSPARTRGTLMPTKRTGGNVMLYGRFSWNLGRPETKGFWPPTRQGYALFWQGFAQSDSCCCALQHKIAVLGKVMLYFARPVATPTTARA